MTGLGFAVAALLVAGVLGLWWRHRQGRVRIASGPAGTADGAELPDAVLRKVDPAASVTLLQLSTPVCARCPQARDVLTDVSTSTGGVEHAELDLAEHPEVSTRLGVRSTPTVLAITRAGRELFRVAGVPRRAELLSALEPHL